MTMLLYKYASASGIKILEDLRLKVTPPNEFNDPFEMTPYSRSTLTIGGMLSILKTNPEWYKQVYDLMVEREGYPYDFARFLGDLPTEIPRRFIVFKRLWRREQSRADLGSLNDASKCMGVICASKVN